MRLTFKSIMTMLPRNIFSRALLLVAVSAPRLLGLGFGSEAAADAGMLGPSKVVHLGASKMSASRISLRQAGHRFRACLSHTGDVNVAGFISATDEFARDLEQFGDWTKRGLSDAKQNIRRVEQKGDRLSSMRQFLGEQLRRGARKPAGGPMSGSAAEALQWSRLGIRFWVETFKEQLKRRRVSLREATINGFQRSMGFYFGRAAKMAFSAASRSTPDWDVIRERTSIGCEAGGVCSEDALVKELQTFVKDVEPVLNRMTELQKDAGLEDLRTP